MKRFVLLVVLTAASAASASMVWIDQADVPTEPLAPSETVVIPVYTDTALLFLDALLELEGPATIVGALDKATAAAYGWEPGFTYDPVVPGTAVEIGAGNFDGAPGPIVGWYLIRCDDYGDVTANLLEAEHYGMCLDIDMERPYVGGAIIIHQVPEPMTMALLGLGGLALLRGRGT